MSPTRKMRLTNKTGKALLLCLEPLPENYDLPAGEAVQLNVLVDNDDAFDLEVHSDPEGVAVVVYSFDERIVSLSGKPLAKVTPQ